MATVGLAQLLTQTMEGELTAEGAEDAEKR